jgi:hypothetical protein
VKTRTNMPSQHACMDESQHTKVRTGTRKRGKPTGGMAASAFPTAACHSCCGRESTRSAGSRSAEVSGEHSTCETSIRVYVKPHKRRRLAPNRAVSPDTQKLSSHTPSRGCPPPLHSSKHVCISHVLKQPLCSRLPRSAYMPFYFSFLFRVF